MNDHQAVVSDRRQITARWLSETLRRNGFLARGRVTSLTVERWRGKLLSDLLRLTVDYSRDAPDSAPAP